MPEFGTQIEGTRKSPLPTGKYDERRRASVHVSDHFTRDEDVTERTDSLATDILEALRALGLADDPLGRKQLYTKAIGPVFAEGWPLHSNWHNPLFADLEE